MQFGEQEKWQRRRCGSASEEAYYSRLQLGIGSGSGGAAKAGRARVIAADLPEPVRWLPPKLVLPGCVAIAARTRFSCYLAGARAVDNTAAKKKDIAEKINHAGFDGLVYATVAAALTNGQRSQQLAEMAQPARCTAVFNI
uniref:Uncharacterized protein n=1 Tax=Oryza glumipatula TaxID=40148 RepID=A0A0D9Y856_9ORYZ